MKNIGSANNGTFELDVFECECGFHVGFDSSYLEQVGDVKFTCPSCKKKSVVKGYDQDED